MSSPSAPSTEVWPALPLAGWKDTYATLHMYTQVIGKVRLRLSPPSNHWWHVTFYPTARGLTTSPMPGGARTFEVEFDFLDHNLVVRTSDGATRTLALVPRSVADFHGEALELLRSLGFEVRIYGVPVEVPDPIPFAEDTRHASYDAAAVARWWQILRQLDIVFKQFRSGFIGKCSPVHFFWGSFDLAVTRFSGRPAPPRPEADFMTREAYSHVAISVGFWPGGGAVDGPALYSYTAPEPAGLAGEGVRPGPAFYHPELKEFVLMYEDVRRAVRPEALILDFAQSTYEAGARLAHAQRKSAPSSADETWALRSRTRHAGKRSRSSATGGS